MNTLQVAVNEYKDRRNRTTHPNGKIDSGGRWYLSENEKCSCCQRIREPSKGYPWSLLKHCRTITHIASLFNVNDRELRKLIKEVK